MQHVNLHERLEASAQRRCLTLSNLVGASRMPMHQTPKPSATSSVNRRMAAAGTMRFLSSSDEKRENTAHTVKRTGVACKHSCTRGSSVHHSAAGFWHAVVHIWCRCTCFQLLDLGLALCVADTVPWAWRRRWRGRRRIHSILLGAPRQQRALRAADTAL